MTEEAIKKIELCLNFSKVKPSWKWIN